MYYVYGILASIAITGAYTWPKPYWGWAVVAFVIFILKMRLQ